MSNLRQIVDVEPPADLTTEIVLLTEMDYKEREHWFEAIDGYGVGLPFDSAQIVLSNHEHGAVTGSVSVEVFHTVAQAATFYQAFPVEISLELGEHASLTLITTEAAQNLVYVIQRCRAVVIGQFYITNLEHVASIQAEIEAYLKRLDSQLAAAYCGDLAVSPPLPTHSSLENPAWDIELPIETYSSIRIDRNRNVFYYVLPITKIYALDAQNGQLLWNHQHADSTWTDISILQVQGTWLYYWLYAKLTKHKALYIFDVEAQTPVATIDDIERRPLAIHEKMMYATLSDKQTLVVRNLAAQSELWRHTFEVNLDYIELTPDISTLLIVSRQTIWACDSQTGAVIWQQELDESVSAWSMNDDLIYVRMRPNSLSATTMAFSLKDGEEQFQIAQLVHLVGSLLYNNAHETYREGYSPYGVGNHDLNAFDPFTGQELWSVPMGLLSSTAVKTNVQLPYNS